MTNAPTVVRFSEGGHIGPYVLVHFLGRGGFGEVWLADRVGGIATTRLALKLPLDNKVDLEAIRQEANLWVRAGNHPNVLPLFEANIYAGQVVFASEYAPDGSMSDWLDRHEGLAPSIQGSIELVLGILAGLQHLHTRGIIHRDLKPANVLLQGEIPRLADFGIARLLSVDAETNRAAGTPAYMAPEAFDGKRSFQTDIWSAGVILFKLLTGSLPFAEKELISLMHSIMSKAPATLPRSISRSVQEVVARALQKDPTQRYPTANQMRHELQMALRRIESIGSSPERPQRENPIQNQVVARPSDRPTVESEGPFPRPVDVNSTDTTKTLSGRKSVSAFLEIASGPNQGTVHELLKDRVVIGRSKDCDIHVTSPEVSRYHAQLVRTENGYSFEDLGTANGSYINGHLVKERLLLRSGDRIHTGAMILLYRQGTENEVMC